jgi:two-component system, NtrC family, response regulator HydG
MSLKTKNILIVDDDLDVLTAVRLLLKSEVKEVITEKNPENLRYLLSQEKFDLLLLDMNFNSSINTGKRHRFELLQTDYDVAQRSNSSAEYRGRRNGF